MFIQPDGEKLHTIAGLVDQGIIRPVVDQVVAFEQTPAALEELLSGGVRGKVVVSTETAAPGDTAELTGDARPQTLAPTWVTAPTQQIDAAGATLAYRELGGFIAQQIALEHPRLVRRVAAAGTGPAGGSGINRLTGSAYVYWDMVRGAAARTDSKEFLFFNSDTTGKAAARQYLPRLEERVSGRDTPIALQALRTQLKAINAWGSTSPRVSPGSPPRR